MENLNKRVANATKWSSITEIIAKLISPVTNMILARLLTPDAFGVVATVTMITSFADVFADAGFQKYIVQHEFENNKSLYDSLDVSFWTNLFISIFAWAMIFVFRDPLARLVGNEGLGNVIVIACISLPIHAFSSLQMALLRRELDFKSLFNVRMVSTIVPFIITIPLAFLLRSYWALVIGTIATSMSNAVVLAIKSPWHPKFSYKFKILKEIFSFSFWTMLEQIFVWLTSYIGIFLISSVLTSHYVGIYKTSISTVNQIISLISASISPVLFSALSKVQNDEAKFSEMLFKFQRISAYLLIPIGVVFFVYSDIIVSVFLGSQWTDATTFVGIWGLISSITVIYSYFISESYRAKGYAKLSFLAQFLHLIFLIPTIYYSVRINFTVLAYSRSLVRLQLILVNFIFCKIFLKISASKMLTNTLTSFISALVMGLVGFYIKNIFPNSIWKFATIAICIAVYFAVLLCFSSARKEILSYVNIFLGKLNKKISHSA